MEPTIYEAVGGYDALVRLAHAWHERCLADPVASHPFGHPGQHPEHLARLATYWAEALGGAQGYTDAMGDHSHVLRLHSGNGEHQELDERAIACFDAALGDAGLPDDERLHETLRAYFRWGTAQMATHPETPDDVPAGLPLPHWSWDGPVEPELLVVTVTDAPGREPRRWTLTCDPPGGTHPDAAGACHVLDTVRAPFAPVPPEVRCPQVYGGPETATVTGTWRGGEVDATYRRTDGCEIARWTKLGAVLSPGAPAGRPV